jgi:hypothetical protein
VGFIFQEVFLPISKAVQSSKQSLLPWASAAAGNLPRPGCSLALALSLCASLDCFLSLGFLFVCLQELQ